MSTQNGYIRRFMQRAVFFNKKSALTNLLGENRNMHVKQEALYILLRACKRDNSHQYLDGKCSLISI